MKAYFKNYFPVLLQNSFVMIQVSANPRSELNINQWDGEKNLISCLSWHYMLKFVSIELTTSGQMNLKNRKWLPEHARGQNELSEIFTLLRIRTRYIW